MSISVGLRYGTTKKSFSTYLCFWLVKLWCKKKLLCISLLPDNLMLSTVLFYMLVVVILLTTSAQVCGKNTGGAWSLKCWSTNSKFLCVCAQNWTSGEKNAETSAELLPLGNFNIGPLACTILFQLQFSSKCGNEYAVFFLFLPPLSVTSLLFLSWDLLPSFGSKVQFFKCELTQSQHFKHSWCQCAAWRSSEVLLVSVLYSKLFCSLFRYFCLFDQTAFWFLHVFFSKKDFSRAEMFPPPPPSTLSLFSTHRCRWENVMLAWLLVGELGL